MAVLKWEETPVREMASGDMSLGFNTSGEPARLTLPASSGGGGLTQKLAWKEIWAATASDFLAVADIGIESGSLLLELTASGQKADPGVPIYITMELYSATNGISPTYYQTDAHEDTVRVQVVSGSLMVVGSSANQIKISKIWERVLVEDTGGTPTPEPTGCPVLADFEFTIGELATGGPAPWSWEVAIPFGAFSLPVTQVVDHTTGCDSIHGIMQAAGPIPLGAMPARITVTNTGSADMYVGVYTVAPDYSANPPGYVATKVVEQKMVPNEEYVFEAQATESEIPAIRTYAGNPGENCQMTLYIEDTAPPPV